MNITITGMPCSGKSSIAEYLSKKYGFEIIRVSQKFREEATKLNMNVLEFNNYLLKNDLAGEFDIKLDNWTIEVGTERINDDIIFDSRLAWYFVPKSFKVFINCSPEIMRKRLTGSNRDKNEVGIKDKNGEDSLLQRVKSEEARYKKIYGISYLNLNNYDLVVDSDNNTIENLAELVYSEYKKFIKK